MARKWFLLVDNGGVAVTSATSVVVGIEDVDTFRDAVFAKVSRAFPAYVIAADLTVYADWKAFKAKQALPQSSSPVRELGKDEASAIIVQVPQRALSEPSYFILPETRERVAKAVFVIVEKDQDDKGVGMGVFKSVGMGVFFSATLAVTWDHNLTEQDTVGSSVSLALKQEIANVVVVARNSELDFAILKSSTPRSFIAPWDGNTDELESRCDLVLASFRLGIDEYQAPYKGKLGFAPAACIAISSRKRHIMFSCPTYAGDSGAALIVKDGCLVGIHQETINALREEMERKKVIKDRLNDVEESLDNIAQSGLAQGCSGLLAHEFKNVVRIRQTASFAAVGNEQSVEDVAVEDDNSRQFILQAKNRPQKQVPQVSHLHFDNWQEQCERHSSIAGQRGEDVKEWRISENEKHVAHPQFIALISIVIAPGVYLIFADHSKPIEIAMGVIHGGVVVNNENGSGKLMTTARP